jgi:hypothetical protein
MVRVAAFRRSEDTQLDLGKEATHVKTAVAMRAVNTPGGDHQVGASSRGKDGGVIVWPYWVAVGVEG